MCHRFGLYLISRAFQLEARRVSDRALSLAQSLIPPPTQQQLLRCQVLSNAATGTSTDAATDSSTATATDFPAVGAAARHAPGLFWWRARLDLWDRWGRRAAGADGDGTAAAVSAEMPPGRISELELVASARPLAALHVVMSAVEGAYVPIKVAKKAKQPSKLVTARSKASIAGSCSGAGARSGAEGANDILDEHEAAAAELVTVSRVRRARLLFSARLKVINAGCTVSPFRFVVGSDFSPPRRQVALKPHACFI